MTAERRRPLPQLTINTGVPSSLSPSPSSNGSLGLPPLQGQSVFSPSSGSMSPLESLSLLDHNSFNAPSPGGPSLSPMPPPSPSLLAMRQQQQQGQRSLGSQPPSHSSTASTSPADAFSPSASNPYQQLPPFQNGSSFADASTSFRQGSAGNRTDSRGSAASATLEGETVWAKGVHQARSQMQQQPSSLRDRSDGSSSAPHKQQPTQLGAGASTPSPADATNGTGKLNPLQDLIATERVYVEDLGAIIKRVAGAWSRSNFPPQPLDDMFRAVEAVYRFSKATAAKLDDIGPSPSSPKALGDLLMRLIPDLEPSYSRYSQVYQLNFSLYPPIAANDRLPPILSSLPWPSTLSPPHPGEIVSLDLLFTLPLERLVYYKRLYAKLLRSTKEGKSDHALIASANETLDRLLEACEEAKGRSLVPVSQIREAMGADQVPFAGIGAGGLRMAGVQQMVGQGGAPAVGMERARSSGESSSKRTSPTSSSDRFTSTPRTSTEAAASLPAPPVGELERRLSTERVLDIFTMQPKKCKLQMAPPSLPFARFLRRDGDLVLNHTPNSDPARRQITVRFAHIFLLTDLFLICERMSPDDQAMRLGRDGQPGPDMWLLYPPLAGKHLRVVEGRRVGELEVTIMKKEKLFLDFGRADIAAEWVRVFEDAIAFGASQGLTAGGSDPSRARSPVSPPSTAPTFQASPSVSSPLSYSPSTQPLHISRSVRDTPPYPPTTSSSMSDFSTLPPSQGNAFRPPPRKASMAPSVTLTDPSYSMPPPVARDSLPPPPPPHSPQYATQPPYGSFSGNGAVTNGTNMTPLSLSYGAPSPHHHPIDDHYAPPSQQRSHSPFRAPTPSSVSSQQNFGPSSSSQASLQKSPSGRSLGSFTSNTTSRSFGYSENAPPPPMPNQHHYSGGFPQSVYSHHANTMPNPRSTYGSDSGLLTPGGSMHRSRSAEGLRDGHFRAPSAALANDPERSHSAPNSNYSRNSRNGDGDDSPPPSPTVPLGPTKTVIAAQMRCKAFLQQNHAQWKSLGTARLKLFVTNPGNTKQMVVESDKSDKKTLVSTIVLTDGVEKVGKTGVAIELSDNGQRTGIIYMLQLKTEQAALGLFGELLLGSDRDPHRSSHGAR